MLKYAKVVNNETKACEVGLGTDSVFYQSIGMTEQDVEQAWDGGWYLTGYAPSKPQAIINAEEVADLKQRLANSDYAIVKIAEADTPEEQQALREQYAVLIAQRKAWRERINELEN